MFNPRPVHVGVVNEEAEGQCFLRVPFVFQVAIQKFKDQDI